MVMLVMVAAVVLKKYAVEVAVVVAVVVDIVETMMVLLR